MQHDRVLPVRSVGQQVIYIKGNGVRQGDNVSWPEQLKIWLATLIDATKVLHKNLVYPSKRPENRHDSLLRFSPWGNRFMPELRHPLAGVRLLSL